MDSGDQITRKNLGVKGNYPSFLRLLENINVPLKNFISGAKPKWSKLRIQDLREFVNRLNNEENESKLIEMFLEKYAELKVELNAKSGKIGKEYTIFQWACSLDKPNLVKILLQKSVNLKIDLNAKDERGYTAFHKVCSSFGDIRIVKILIENTEYSKLDLKIKTPIGKTAFQLAELFRQDIVDLFKQKLPAGAF